MVQYASGSIKFSGLGSDTDFQAMIDKLYNIESRYANQLLKWKADWQTRLDAFKQVRTEMLNLQTALKGINSVNKFMVKTATSSDEKVVTGVANADAMNGTYSLDIKQLASQYSWSKNTNLYEKNDVVCDDNAGGVFQYRYKGKERTLYIPKGTTIEGLKNIINNDSQNLGVKAQLITSQDGIVFQLQSKETGSANSLVIQKTDGMSPFGDMKLTNQKYIEDGSSMTLASRTFSSTGDDIDPSNSNNDIINKTSEIKTFTFTVDGKKKSISVQPGATIKDLIGEINVWGAANFPTKNGEKLASLEEFEPGKFHLKIEKNDTVYCAGIYNDALYDVMTSSYADENAEIPAGTYDLYIAPPVGNVQAPDAANPLDRTPISVTLGAGSTLKDLRNAFRTAIDGSVYNTTVDIVTDPNDPSKSKLTFGPVVNDALQGILDDSWDNSSSPITIPTGDTREYMLRLTNSDTGAKDSDIMKITLTAGTYTIKSLCDTINLGLGNKGTAKLIPDEGQAGKWKLVIEPKNVTHRVNVEDGTLEGMKYSLPEEESGTWLIMAGQNARLRVNGWPKEPEYLESASNNIAAGAVIDGMSLTLRSVGPAVISVANDTQKVAENVQAFVDAVNSFRTVLQSLTAYDEEKTTLDPDYAESQYEMQKGSVLTGNYGIQLLSSRLKTAIASSAIGFTHQMKDALTGYVSGDIFSSLSQIGITTNADKGHASYGLLEINTVSGYKGMKSLQDALAADPEAVARLFSSYNEGVSNNQELFQHNSHVAGIAKAGTYDVEYTVAMDGNGDPYIDSAFINGQPAKIDSAGRQITLVAPENDPARSIVLDIYDMTPGVTHKGSVSIKEGKVNELLAMMNGSEGMLGEKGTLKNLENNYKTIIENIEKKIKQEDDRLVKWRRTMDNKFARLDAVLAKYNSINESLKTQIAQLGVNSGKK